MNSRKLGKATLRERFREESAQEILSAAELVFTREGLVGAGMAQIAEQAGVAVGTLYNRFKDRDALLQALLEQRRAELLERLDGVAEQLTHFPLRERLTGVVHALILHCEEHRPFLRLVLASEWGHGPSKESMLRALRERLQAVLGEAAELRTDAHAAFAVLLISLVRGTLERDRFGLPMLDSATAASQIVEFFLKGAGR